MTATAEAAAMLAEAMRRGIELRADGGRLRYRPRSAMTADLAGRLRACKGELLVMLQAADVAEQAGPRRRAARMIRQARQAGDGDLAVALRDAWHERVAVCEIDAGLPTEQAEQVAERDTQGDQDQQGVAVRHQQGHGDRPGAVVKADERAGRAEHIKPGTAGRLPRAGSNNPSKGREGQVDQWRA